MVGGLIIGAAWVIAELIELAKALGARKYKIEVASRFGSGFPEGMATPRSILLTALVLGTWMTPPLDADGKFYVPRDVPRPGEPFQRALTIHDAGREFLLVQPSAVGEVKEFGWVIPTLSVPAVGSLDVEEASSIFEQLQWRSRPEIRRVSVAWVLAVLAALAFGAIVTLAFRRKLTWTRFAVLVVPTAMFMFLGFVVVVSAAGRSPGEVDVLASARVGLYDVKVVNASESEALRAWFDAQGFAIGPDDEKVFRSLIDRNWSFVAARVAPEDADQERELTSLDGLIQPLALLFESSEPIYPYALTATAGHAVEVVLYVAAKHRVECPALETDYSAPGWSLHPSWLGRMKSSEGPERFSISPGTFVTWSLGAESGPEAVRFPEAKWLTKLRASIIPGKVEGDLVLVPGSDESYLRVRYVLSLFSGV